MAQEATELENIPKRSKLGFSQSFGIVDLLISVVPRRRAKDMVSKVIADMTTDQTMSSPVKKKRKPMKRPRDPNMPRLIEQRPHETIPNLKDSEACTSEPFPDIKIELMEVVSTERNAVDGLEGISGPKIPLQDIEELTDFKAIQFGMYVCEFCSTRLKNYSEYTTHVVTHNECHSVCCMCSLPDTPFSITAFSKHAVTHFEAVSLVSDI